MTFSEMDASPSPAATDPHQAHSSRSRRSPSAAAGSGPTPPTRTAGSSSWAPRPRPRTGSPSRCWELGELGAAREHYQAALALDPTNRIAERNIDRLKTLLVAAGDKTVPAQDGSKAPVRIFVEETGKTGFAYLTDLRRLPQARPGQPGRLPSSSRPRAIA